MSFEHTIEATSIMGNHNNRNFAGVVGEIQTAPQKNFNQNKSLLFFGCKQIHRLVISSNICWVIGTQIAASHSIWFTKSWAMRAFTFMVWCPLSVACTFIVGWENFVSYLVAFATMLFEYLIDLDYEIFLKRRQTHRFYFYHGALFYDSLSLNTYLSCLFRLYNSRGK